MNLQKMKIGFLCGGLIFAAAAFCGETAPEPKLRQAIKLVEEKKYEEAEKIFLELGSRNDSEALYQLAHLYLQQEKCNDALLAFKRATELGNLNAKYKYALMLRFGIGNVKPDLALSFKCFKELAEVSDNPNVCYYYGRALLFGDGCEKNEKEAVIHLKKAADSEDPEGNFKNEIGEAQLFLGFYYFDIAKDYKQAIVYLEGAAEHNYPEAWGKLGYIYAAGLGLKKPNPDWAIRCYLAREKLEPGGETEFNLGILYGEKGEYEEAIKWMKLSAAKNYQLAIQYLNDKKELERIRKIQQDKKKTPFSFQSLMGYYRKSAGEAFGTDAKKFLAEIMGVNELTQNADYLMLPIPENMKMAGWIYDSETASAEIEKHLMTSHYGVSAWMTDEFEKIPVSKNLAALNPTIRGINFSFEKALKDALKKSVYQPMKPEEMNAMLKKLDPEMIGEEFENSAWKIMDNLYFLIHTDFSGRWNLRYYHFICWDGKEAISLAEFGIPPSRDYADIALGIFNKNLDCLNNYAVLILQEKIGSAITDTEEAEAILLTLADQKHAAGTYNLAVYYKSIKEEEKAKKYFELAKKFAGSRK